MKYAWLSIVLFTIAGTANASTSSFYGTGSADTIVVGRAYDDVGNFIYMACVNGAWTYGNAVTGSSDVVTVYGYGGADTITIRAVNDTFNCGGDGKTLYRMDYSYACPGTITVNAGAGNDVINGAQCAEHLYGDDGDDTIFGGPGNDSIYGGLGNDCIQDDTLYTLSCGDGTDKYSDDYAWKDCETHVMYCLL